MATATVCDEDQLRPIFGRYCGICGKIVAVFWQNDQAGHDEAVNSTNDRNAGGTSSAYCDAGPVFHA